MEFTNLSMKELTALKEEVEKEYKTRREQVAEDYALRILNLIVAAEEEGFEVAIDKETWQDANDCAICVSDPELDDD